MFLRSNARAERRFIDVLALQRARRGPDGPWGAAAGDVRRGARGQPYGRGGGALLEWDGARAGAGTRRGAGAGRGAPFETRRHGILGSMDTGRGGARGAGAR